MPLLRLILLLVLAAAPAKRRPGGIYVTDWDYTVMKLKVPMGLVKKGTRDKIQIDVDTFARERDNIGIRGELKDYERAKDMEVALGDRKTKPHENRFIEQIKTALLGPGWKAESWDAFAAALSHPESAKQTYILTGRYHAPKTIYAGLRFLQRRGLIKHLPPIENILTTHGRYGRARNHPSIERKAYALKGMLDRLETRLRKQEPPPGEQTLFTMADDDPDYFREFFRLLQQHLADWPHVRIQLHFAGVNIPGLRPFTMELTPKSKLPAALEADAFQ